MSSVIDATALLAGPTLIPLPHSVLTVLWVVVAVGVAVSLLVKQRGGVRPGPPQPEPPRPPEPPGTKHDRRVFGLPRAFVENTALVVGIVVLFGGFAAFLVYVDHSDKQVKRRVTSAMHDLPMGSTPAEMRSRLGEPYGAKVRKIDGQRAFCLGWTINSEWGDADLRWACYVHDRRVT